MTRRLGNCEKQQQWGLSLSTARDREGTKFYNQLAMMCVHADEEIHVLESFRIGPIFKTQKEVDLWFDRCREGIGAALEALFNVQIATKDRVPKMLREDKELVVRDDGTVGPFDPTKHSDA